MDEMRALVVDDSGAIRSYLRRILSAHGFNVLEAKDGLEGLERLQALDGVDLVLMDWNMPVMSGIELLLRLRSDPTFNDVCVMMVSSETDIAELTYALDAGANDYVMKPFTSEMISEKLQLLGFPSAAA
jgi:two-component system chemotaxis response regulator CheY